MKSVESIPTRNKYAELIGEAAALIESTGKPVEVERSDLKRFGKAKPVTVYQSLRKQALLAGLKFGTRRGTYFVTKP